MVNLVKSLRYLTRYTHNLKELREPWSAHIENLTLNFSSLSFAIFVYLCGYRFICGLFIFGLSDITWHHVTSRHLSFFHKRSDFHFANLQFCRFVVLARTVH